MSKSEQQAGDAVAKRPYDEFLEFVQNRAEIDSTFSTADELVANQVERISTVDNIDDLFESMKIAGLSGLRDLENGTELQIKGYHLVKSTREDLSGRTGVYAVIDAINLGTGEDIALDTSVERILVFLLKCEQLGKFPIDVRVEKKHTQTGNELITFGKIPARTARSQAA